MSEFTATPCTWPLAYACADCTNGDCAGLGGLDIAKRRLIEAMAVEMLWSWTNRVFGACDVVVRPCLSGCGGIGGRETYWGRGPYPQAGMATAFDCACTGACRCALDGARSIALPGPVVSIDQVLVDGVIVPDTAYRVAYGRYLVRTDGETWPGCQDLILEATETGTFEVQYSKGVPVPAGGQLAAGMLACELAKAYCNDRSCALPKRIRDITREGVTVTMMDSFEDLKEGGTGIWAIDSWTAAVNKPRSYSAVRSVDIPKDRVGSRAYRL